MISTRFTSAMAFCFALLSLGAAVASAQSPLRVTLVNPHEAVEGGIKTSYTFRMDNIGTSDITYRVIRVVNQLPDTGWASGLCVPSICYPYDQDTIVAPVLKPGEPSALFLDVYLGGFGSGRVMLRFDTGEGTESFTREVTFRVVDYSDLSGVESETPVSALPGAPYPNPALSVITIPVGPAAARASATGLVLFNTRGEAVADLSEEARRAADGDGSVKLDVRGLAPGAYFYRLTVGGAEAVRSFIVHR